jgi:hypothetical protein
MTYVNCARSAEKREPIPGKEDASHEWINDEPLFVTSPTRTRKRPAAPHLTVVCPAGHKESKKRRINTEK